MRQYEAAEHLLASISKYDAAVVGDSDDDEIAAAVEMKAAALEYLRLSAGSDVMLADLVDVYEKAEADTSEADSGKSEDVEEDEECECGRRMSECATAEGAEYHLDRDDYLKYGVPQWMK